jgi:hypothetical protein
MGRSISFSLALWTCLWFAPLPLQGKASAPH